MKDKLKQFILFGVCSSLALAICMAVLVVTVKNLENDSVSSEAVKIESKTQLDNSKATLSAYLNNLISDTNGKFVKTSTNTSVSVNDLIVTDSLDKSKNDTEFFSFVKDKMLSTVDSFYPADNEGTFADGNSTKLNIEINNKYIGNAAFSIGQVNENGESVYDDDGKIVDEEYYYLTYALNAESVLSNKALVKALGLNNDTKAKAAFISAVKGNCSLSDFTAELTDITLSLKVNRTNDHIACLDVIKAYNVKFNAEPLGDLASLGSKAVAFSYSVKDTYEYYYCGITLSEATLNLAEGEEYALTVNAVIDDDSDYTVEFISSDDAIATVDEMGYVKGVSASDKPVTITVKLSYLGKEFTDTCAVNVSHENGGA